MNTKPVNYFEASARTRITCLVDTESFSEICPPHLRHTSPHLARLNAPVAFDDGVIVGRATVAGHQVLIASQEGKFNGGAVGEVHGAKLRGLMDKALSEGASPAAKCGAPWAMPPAWLMTTSVRSGQQLPSCSENMLKTA